MFSKLLLIALILCSKINVAEAEPNEKVAALKRVTDISTRLIEISKGRLEFATMGKKLEDSKLKSDIEALLKHENDPEVLAKVALASSLFMSPGLAEDQVIDNVFDESWRSCIVRIESIGGIGAIYALEDIQRSRPIDGAFALLLGESLQRLKRKIITK